MGRWDLQKFFFHTSRTTVNERSCAIATRIIIISSAKRIQLKPVSSFTSRMAQSSGDSPFSNLPPMPIIFSSGKMLNADVIKKIDKSFHL